MSLNRFKDVTYVNSYDDFNYHMNKSNFQTWFKQEGQPEYEFSFEHDSNNVWNESSMTLQKYTGYNFYIVTAKWKKCLVCKKHIRHNDVVERELIKRYTTWINKIKVLQKP